MTPTTPKTPSDWPIKRYKSFIFPRKSISSPRPRIKPFRIVHHVFWVVYRNHSRKIPISEKTGRVCFRRRKMVRAGPKTLRNSKYLGSEENSIFVMKLYSVFSLEWTERQWIKIPASNQHSEL